MKATSNSLIATIATPPASPARVGFLLIDDFALMSRFASAVEPSRAANSLAGRRLYEWLILTVDLERRSVLQMA